MRGEGRLTKGGDRRGSAEEREEARDGSSLILFPPDFTLLFGTSSQESRAQGMYRRDGGGERRVEGEVERTEMMEKNESEGELVEGSNERIRNAGSKLSRASEDARRQRIGTMKISPSFVGAAVAVAGQGPAGRGNGRGVATLLCSVHAPGISQLADRPHVPCGEAIPENGTSGFLGVKWTLRTLKP